MTDAVARQPLSQSQREKRRVALASLAAALLLTGTKLGVGCWTNSLGILSEAAHSGLDLVAAAITLWAVRISGQPADREHTYGHGKVENLSALAETLLLLATCAWIVYEAAGRLWSCTAIHVEANVWAFGVVLLSIVVDFSRSAPCGRPPRSTPARRWRPTPCTSPPTSGRRPWCCWAFAGVRAGDALGLPGSSRPTPWRPWASPRSSSASASGWARSRSTICWTAFPQGLHGSVAAAVRQVAGVEEVTRLRLRRSGPDIFADVAVAVGRGAAFERAHDIADDVEAAVHAVLPNADVVVHVEPIAPETEDVTATVRLLAARHGLGAHGIRIYEENRQRWLELHLEVSDSLLLDDGPPSGDRVRAGAAQESARGDADRHAHRAGRRRRRDDPRRAGRPLAGAAGDRRAFWPAIPRRSTAHDIRVQLAGGELAVSFHCALDPATAITEAHELTVRLEEHLRRQVPGLGRVAIHVEPCPGKPA